MTTTKKLVVAVVALSLALVTFAGATLAFLIDSTDPVVNTFTYGQIDITLTETKGEEQADNSRLFKDVVPGDSVAKDPTVTVQAGSESCYVYVKIDNNLGNADVTTDMNTENWIAVGTKGTVTLYRYKDIVTATTAKTLPVFTKVNFPGDLTVDDITALKAEGKKIEIQAYAHQSKNTDVATANAAAIAWAKVDAVTNP